MHRVEGVNGRGVRSSGNGPARGSSGVETKACRCRCRRCRGRISTSAISYLTPRMRPLGRGSRGLLAVVRHRVCRGSRSICTTTSCQAVSFMTGQGQRIRGCRRRRGRCGGRSVAGRFVTSDCRF